MALLIVYPSLFFSRWTRICLSTSSNQKTSELSLKNLISSGVGISTPVPGIFNLISNSNSSWCVELLMAYQNNYFGANLVVPDLVYSCRFLPVISSHFPGGFTRTLLDSGYHHVCCCLIIEEKSIVWSSSWGVFFPNAPPFPEPSFTLSISEIIISRISK